MPLVLTLLLDEASTARFEVLRRAHFPADRLVVGAHVTLFHALPEVPAVAEAVAREAARAPFDVTVTGVRSLGRGVAYVLAAPEAVSVRRALLPLAQTDQDRRKRDLHVTVQNKVAPEVARALHAELAAGFVAWTASAVGLALWRYVGGPWEPVSRHPFRGGAAP